MMKNTLKTSSLCFFGLVFLTPGLWAGELDINLGRGPVTVQIPTSYNASVPMPLVLSLHGYTGTGAGHEAYFQMAPVAETRGFLYAYPDGTSDPVGQFWNATDACCNFIGSSVDDSAYLRDLIVAVSAQLNVDPERVFIMGHSNGGFMSYRMACDNADLVAAVASLAGATWNNAANCNPSLPVRVLQIHGTNDDVILYDGGTIVATYPSAVETVEQWAVFNGCSLNPQIFSEELDLDSSISGAESTRTLYAEGCAAGSSVELWTIPEGSHSPPLTDDFRQGVIDFFLGTVFNDGFESGDLSNWSGTG